MTTSDLVLLDFDGVINAESKNPMRSAHARWERTVLLDQPILYSPDVVDAVNEISRRPHVTVKWLTSWTSSSREFAALGFDAFDFVPPLPSFTGDVLFGALWKGEAGLAAAADWDGTVVWVDNDYWIAKQVQAAGRSNITYVQPTASLGLSRRQLRELSDLTSE